MWSAKNSTVAQSKHWANIIYHYYFHHIIYTFTREKLERFITKIICIWIQLYPIKKYKADSNQYSLNDGSISAEIL